MNYFQIGFDEGSRVTLTAIGFILPILLILILLIVFVFLVAYILDLIG